MAELSPTTVQTNQPSPVATCVPESMMGEGTE